MRKLAGKTLLCVLCFAFFFMAAGASAQETVTFNFNDADLESVIKSVAKITGKTFIIDPKVKGKVTIISTEPLPREEVYPLFLSILQVHDFAAVEAGPVVKIIPFAQAKQDMVETETPGPGAPEIPEDRLVTQLYKLEHVPADKLAAVLRPLVTAQSYLAAHKESNSLIISDRAGNVERLLRIIKRVDRESAGEIDVVRLEQADAREVVSVVEGLEIRSGKVTADQLRMVADGRTNSILLGGDPQHVLRAKALIAHLDTPIESEGSTQVIFLRYAKAKDLVGVLTGLKPDLQKQPGVAAGQASEVSIQADEGTNALIITAPPAVMQALQSVIRQLDIRRVQLMIEAVIAEVSSNKSADLGVQWRSTDVVSANNSGLIGGTNFPASGVPINLVNEDGLGAIGNLNGFALGYFKGTTEILGTEFVNLGALVSALATDGDTNILSTPTLVTMDNQEAEIVVGQNVPFITGSFTNTGSANSAVNPFQTIERQDVGLKLRVKPQINAGGVIRLDIRQEVSSIQAFRSEGPVTSTRTINTSVMVEDGKVLVLGGLISDDVQETVQKVPLLGDLPLIGLAFRHTNTTHDKRNLMVFLRPVIMEDEGVNRRISFDKYDYIRQRQMERAEGGVSLMPRDEQPVLPAYDEMENVESPVQEGDK